MFKPIKNSIHIIYIVLIFMLLTTACSAKSSIVGKWEDTVGAGVTFEFFKDGTMTATTSGMALTGDYEFIDKDTIRVDMTGLLGLAGSTVFDVSLSGDSLTLSTSGFIISLQRVE
jgi:hypothetical protein